MSDQLPDIERLTLGIAMQGPEQLDAVRDILEPADFADVRHGEIFRALCLHVDTGGPCEPVAIARAVAEQKIRLPTNDYVFTLWQCGGSAAGSAKWYAQLVADASRLRHYSIIGARLIQAADHGQLDDVATILGSAGRSVPRKRRRLCDRAYTLDQAAAIPAPTPMPGNIINRRSVAMIAGKFGTYKSFLSIAWACSIATGKPWEGHEVPEPGTVLYIAAEGVSGVRRRVLAWGAGHGVDVPSERFIIVDGRVKLDEPEDVSELIEYAKEVKPILIVVDTLHQCAPGVDEDKAKEMGPILGACFDVRDETGASILLNHHTGHRGNRSRGSSALEDDIDHSWVIHLEDEENRGIHCQRTLKHRKSKDSKLSDDIPIVLREVAELDSAFVEAGVVDSGRVLSGSVAVEAMVARLDSLDIPNSYGRERCLSELVSAGFPPGDRAILAEAIKVRKARGAD